MTKATSSSDKIELEKRLASLIGFDEVSELFEHCLSFHTSEELLEYMSGLLGQSDEKVQIFCIDVGSFKRGGPISILSGEGQNPSLKSDANSRAPLDYSAGVGTKKKQKAKGNNNPSQNKRAGSKLNKAAKRDQLLQRKNVKKGGNSDVSQSSSKGAQKQNMNQAFAVAAHPHVNKNQESSQSKADRKLSPETSSINDKPLKQSASQRKPANTTAPKVKPIAKGKAKIDCGCFGTIHEPLTNCLHCGRIICKREGYGFCPFCEYEVENPRNLNLKIDSKSQQHKERLLKFDREFAQRTKVLDDQADYYSNSTSTWLTEEQQLEAAEKEENRRKDLHQRKKQVLTIDLN